MSRIRGKDTTPEKRVRSLLHRMGCRFRLHVRIPVSKEGSRKRAQRVLPAKHAKYAKTGARTALSAFHPSADNPRSATHALRFTVPDIILPRYKTAIFVHGCFWHGHRGCRNCTTPTHRRAFWVNKLEGNAARDRLHQRALPKLGWRVIVIWECATEKPIRLDRKLRKLLSRPAPLNKFPNKAP